eukprot:Nk52_evm6s2578 gene=Nk52_evmTU6s2578
MSRASQMSKASQLSKSSSYSHRSSQSKNSKGSDKSGEANLQHISDRRGCDEVYDDSNGTLFMQCIPDSEIEKSRRRSSSYRQEGGMVKFNSCSTLHVDETVTTPDLEDTLHCFSLALQYTISAGHQQPSPKFDKVFDEMEFPLNNEPVPRDYNKTVPDLEDIYEFAHSLFKAASLTGESVIITLVYIERLITNTELTLHASNWKRVVLGATMLASKVWDDQAVWNVDFCSILPDIPVSDMNDLERDFLEMILFNVSVNAGVYATYYFDLRILAENACRSFSLAPLDKEQAERLEAFSVPKGTKKSPSNDVVKRSKSAEMAKDRKPIAIIS